jgi:hypothetical protein
MVVMTMTTSWLDIETRALVLTTAVVRGDEETTGALLDAAGALALLRCEGWLPWLLDAGGGACVEGAGVVDGAGCGVDWLGVLTGGGGFDVGGRCEDAGGVDDAGGGGGDVVAPVPWA